MEDQSGDARHHADKSQQQAEQVTEEEADRNREVLQAATSTSKKALDRGKAERDVQAEQAVVLAKEFIETQTDVMEVAMLSIGNATDVGNNSSRLLVSYGSAWIDMMQRLIQFNIDNLRRMRETRGFTRTLEAQAGMMRESLSQWANTQSRMAEQARATANEAGRQFQHSR